MLLAVVAAALAQSPDAVRARPFLMEVNFRSRYLSLPDSVLDIWMEKHEGEAYERPLVHGYALGLEFVVKDEQANGIFYVEYMGSLLEEGYWDDRDNPADYDDGSYIVPEKFGLVALGANYAYELPATEWLSFLFGAGLGVAFTTGELVEWEPGETGAPTQDNTDPDCGGEDPAYMRVKDCPDDGAVAVPGVLPIVDINLGVRFNISDRASIRLEGGLHDMLYGGTAVGIVF